MSIDKAVAENWFPNYTSRPESPLYKGIPEENGRYSRFLLMIQLNKKKQAKPLSGGKPYTWG